MYERKREFDNRAGEFLFVVHREDEVSVDIVGGHRLDDMRLSDGVELRSPFAVWWDGPAFEGAYVWSSICWKEE